MWVTSEMLDSTAESLTQRQGVLSIAWLGSTAFTTTDSISYYRFDASRHTWDVPIPNFEKIALVAWVAELTFLITGGATKVSILLFYRRLVDGAYPKRWKYAVLAALWFTAAWTVAFSLALVFNCRPTKAYWKAFDPLWNEKYHCENTKVNNLLSGIFTVTSDVYTVLLPTIMTHDLSLPIRQRIALNAIFAFGFLVAGASIARTYYLWNAASNSDIVWQLANAFICAHLELQLGIICASLPAFRVFFREYLSEPISRFRSGGESWRDSLIEVESIRLRLTNDKVVQRLPRRSVHGEGSTISSAMPRTTKDFAESDDWPLPPLALPPVRSTMGAKP